MQILLLSSTVRNNMAFVDSGATLDVGDGPTEIVAARADQLIATNQAVDASSQAAEADEQ